MAIISDGNVAFNQDGSLIDVLVTWITDEDADSTVTYGLGSAPNGSNQAGVQRASTQVTSHAVTITGFTASTAYWVQVSSSDATGTPLGYDPSFPNGVISFQTPALNNGGTQDATPTISQPTATGVSISWNSSDSGIGSVNYNIDGSSTVMQESETASTLAHSVTLSDLIGSTQYDFTYQTDFDDPSLAPAISAECNFTTAADTTPPDPPGRMGMSANPMRILIGQTATIMVQILKRDKTAVVGVPVAFTLGDGNAQGTLSASSGITDSTGKCQTVFKATGLGPKVVRAHRFIVAVAGTAPQTKRHRVMLVVSAK